MILLKNVLNLSFIDVTTDGHHLYPTFSVVHRNTIFAVNHTPLYIYEHVKQIGISRKMLSRH
jgi:hypothetical protein